MADEKKFPRNGAPMPNGQPSKDAPGRKELTADELRALQKKNGAGGGHRAGGQGLPREAGGGARQGQRPASAGVCSVPLVREYVKQMKAAIAGL